MDKGYVQIQRDPMLICQLKQISQNGFSNT